MIEVSAGVVFNEEGRILICQRGEGRSNAHLWEFPGGKREEGESAEECLRRELMEELRLPVTEVQELMRSVSQPPFIRHPGHPPQIALTFLTAKTTAEPVLTEHEDARFVLPRELLHYRFCPADVYAARVMALRGIRHIFWDFDGTLLDSYPGMVRAFAAAAAEYGVAITPERTLELMKNCLRHCCEVVGAENGIPAGALACAFRRHEEAELRKGLEPMPLVEDTLRKLHARGVKHYVATHRDLVSRDLLERAGLLRYFSGFVTEEDGLPRKPAPDMLLHLMQKHGLAPEECMMIGDRPLDTEAGMAAGVTSVLIAPKDRFPGAACDIRLTDAGFLTLWMT